MGIRKYNPTTPGRRGATVNDFAELKAVQKDDSLQKNRLGSLIVQNIWLGSILPEFDREKYSYH